jgi:hypothetical protein
VDQSAWHLLRPFARPELREDFSGTNLSRPLRVAIRPQELMPIAQSAFHCFLCVANVLVKALEDFWSELSFACSAWHRPGSWKC